MTQKLKLRLTEPAYYAFVVQVKIYEDEEGDIACETTADGLPIRHPASDLELSIKSYRALQSIAELFENDARAQLAEETLNNEDYFNNLNQQP